VALELPDDAASTYDPYQRGAGKVGDPERAVDGKNGTAWTAPVGDDGDVRIGLAISLAKAQALDSLELRADTPGFTVEVYATKESRLPPDILDSRWKHLKNKTDVGVTTDVDLNGTYRHVLLWIREQPADTKVAIPEVKLFPKED
jgi:hypothetical protein